MASKLTLIDISSGFKGTDVNTNFTSIEDEFDDTLSRTGKSPNAMNAELDMNSNKIQNLGPPTLNQDAARLKDLSEDNATSKAATAVTIDDADGYYSSDNVEGALKEIFGTYFTEVTDEVTATHTELNKLDGVTASTSEINKLDGVTATTAELNNADADATGGGFLIGPTSSSGAGASFDAWLSVAGNSPVLITLGLDIWTDGSSNGSVTVHVDEDGGTSADYTINTLAPSVTASSNANFRYVFSFIVPGGGSFQIENSGDPTGSNSITLQRQWQFS